MFDTIALAVIGIWTLLGLVKGLVKQVIGLAGAVAGYVLAVKYSGAVAAKFLPGFTPVTGQIVAFLAIFFACAIAASLIGSVIGRAISAVGLGILNRIGGGAMGAAKACFVLAVVTMLMIAFLPPSSDVLRGSRVIEHIRPLTDMVSRAAPGGIEKKYRENAAKLERLPGKKR